MDAIQDSSRFLCAQSRVLGDYSQGHQDAHRYPKSGGAQRAAAPGVHVRTVVIFWHCVDILPCLRVNDLVHIAPNNVPSKAKVQEIARNAAGKDAKLLPKGSFSVSLEAVEPDEQAIMSISYAVATVQSMKPMASMLDPPSGVIGFKK